MVGVAKWLLFSTEEYVNLVPLVPQTPIGNLEKYDTKRHWKKSYDTIRHWEYDTKRHWKKSYDTIHHFASMIQYVGYFVHFPLKL